MKYDLDIKRAANEHYHHIKSTYYKGNELSELEVIDAFIEGAKYGITKVISTTEKQQQLKNK